MRRFSSILQKPSTIYLWLKRVSAGVYGDGRRKQNEMNTMLEEVGEVAVIRWRLLYSWCQIGKSSACIRRLQRWIDVSELGGEATLQSVTAKPLLEKPDIYYSTTDKLLGRRRTYRIVQTLLAEYENTFILISHDIPFLNLASSIWFTIWTIKELNRYVRDYDQFKSICDEEISTRSGVQSRQQRD